MWQLLFTELRSSAAVDVQAESCSHCICFSKAPAPSVRSSATTVLNLQFIFVQASQLVQVPIAYWTSVLASSQPRE
jgi:hypothetical protein